MSDPLITADLPGCGGLTKARPEDFQVEEVPAYGPCGEGEHLLLWVEKVGLSTPEVAGALARHLGLSEREVSYAGLKDKQALTLQLFCVPARVEPLAPTFSLPGARLLWAVRHRNKLKTGHLRGNRFRIRVRGPSEPQAAREVLSALGLRGVPNYFGEQRFGREGDNARVGRAILLGKGPKVDRFRRRLYLSSLQSALFNRALADRIRAGTFAKALAGDVLKKADTGGEFVCEDAGVEQGRLDRFELSPAGPLFGPKMTQSGGEVAAAEARLLRSEDLTAEDFERGRGETQGARRAYRLKLEGASIESEGTDLWLSFALPTGSYATVVLREVMK